MRLAPPTASVSAGFATLHNRTSNTVTVTGATCACAKSVELHVMEERDGVMRMRKVEQFEVAAGTSLELAPGGPHLMFLGLTRPLSAGSQLEVTLEFADGTSQQVAFAVRDPR